MIADAEPKSRPRPQQYRLGRCGGAADGVTVPDRAEMPVGCARRGDCGTARREHRRPAPRGRIFDDPPRPTGPYAAIDDLLLDLISDDDTAS